MRVASHKIGIMCRTWRTPGACRVDTRVDAWPFFAIAQETGIEMSHDAARTSVPITFRITMVMKIKDLPTAASFTFEGACATSLPERYAVWNQP